jgi:hypothetical protein
VRSVEAAEGSVRNRKSRADLLFRRRRWVRDIGNEGQWSGTPGDGRMILIGVPGVSRGCGQWLDRCAACNSEEAAVIVSVTRSGGFAGLTMHGELDVDAQPDADRLEAAVRALGAKDLGTGRPQPDRYVYRLEVRDAQDADATQTTHTVAEQDVDATTAWLLDRVLSR